MSWVIKNLEALNDEGKLARQLVPGDHVWWQVGERADHARVSAQFDGDTDLDGLVSLVRYATPFTRDEVSRIDAHADTLWVLPAGTASVDRSLWNWVCDVSQELENIADDGLTGTGPLENTEMVYVQGFSLRPTQALASIPSCFDFALYRTRLDPVPMVETEFTVHENQLVLEVHSFRRKKFVVKEKGSALKVAKHLAKQYADNVAAPQTATHLHNRHKLARGPLSEEERRHAQPSISGGGQQYLHDGQGNWVPDNYHGGNRPPAPVRQAQAPQRSAATRDMGERVGGFVRRSTSVYAQRWDPYSKTNTDYALTIREQRLTVHQCKAVLEFMQNLLEENAQPERLVVEA